MSRWVVWLPLTVLAALAVLFVGFGLRHDPHVNPAALVGKPLPALTLAGFEGASPSPLRAAVMEQAASGPTLLNVFASWCAPCIQEAPALTALKARGVRLVGVAYKDDPANTRRFLDENGDPFERILVDRDGDAGIELGVSGVPETFLVGADGRVLAKHSGPLNAPDAEAFLKRVGAAEPGR